MDYELFEKGQKVVRVGKTMEQYGMYQGNVYIVESCNRTLLKLVGVNQTFGPKQFRKSYMK